MNLFLTSQNISAIFTATSRAHSLRWATAYCKLYISKYRAAKKLSFSRQKHNISKMKSPCLILVVFWATCISISTSLPPASSKAPLSERYMDDGQNFCPQRPSCSNDHDCWPCKCVTSSGRHMCINPDGWR
uniref:Uncharacterized protein n=1 Tax=Rhipicephalus zambeziensis TaxID=60191 RepID=A0A224Y7F2_9ACAR